MTTAEGGSDGVRTWAQVKGPDRPASPQAHTSLLAKTPALQREPLRTGFVTSLPAERQQGTGLGRGQAGGGSS